MAKASFGAGLQRLASYETEELEYKATTGETCEGIVSLCAMLNRHGHGVVCFGVQNDGTVTGQDIGTNTTKKLSEAIAANIRPEVIPDITILKAEGCSYIRVEVSGAERPYSAYGKYYMRSADEDRSLSPNELRKLMLLTVPNLFTVVPASAQDLTFNQFKALYANKGLSVNESQFDNNHGLLTADGRFNQMAYILADSNDVSIKVVRFKGEDNSFLLKRNEFGNQCMLVAMNQAALYVESLNETIVDMTGWQRRDTQLFKAGAFREAWANACLHNSWYRMVPPYIGIYDDRMEIVSAGGLPDGMTEDDFYAGISRPVNPELQKIMGQLGYVEQTGHGVQEIIREYGKDVFHFSDNFLVVAIPFAFRLGNECINESISGSTLGKLALQQQILEYIKDSPHITIAQLSAKCNVSSATVSNCLSGMAKDGVIAREGARKNGTWKVL